MVFSSLLTLLDDIASVLDDVALMTKVAAKKTAGVVGDDLALNANQVTGVRADRELPIVWAVAKGSLVNKLILIPAALLLSVFSPVLITFSFCILMALDVVFSNVWGILLKEWKGCGRRTIAVLVVGIAILVVSSFLPQLL